LTGHDLAGDEPIEQVVDRGEPLLDTRCRELARTVTDLARRRRPVLCEYRSLRRRSKGWLAASRPRAKHVLLDADSVNFIDTSACDAVLNTIKELQSQGITFVFARVRDEVRERLRLGGIEAIVGASNFYERVTTACAPGKSKNGSPLRPRDRKANERWLCGRGALVQAEPCAPALTVPGFKRT
jgi:anti-anti-sigma factor